ncbi:MAG: hypothetical protein CL944_02190 [Candidatus Diapherotrites archaeon]|uniref:Uncharacterized protein n=1 Tax=Candidatus Iainarchaeum sp. TaxID=3101447 RepID=A0A2D6LQ20_9ARCH|nr:hypothetical protein [Candidatus Diapherotrites archaeon]|tara:strand:+ start:12828 stop:13196 length:369 start_codon:yes stop_codon:yes gene_type:complete
MSLVTLTFGNKAANASPHVFISTPEERIIQKLNHSGTAKGEAIIKKACRFYSEENVYVVAEVTEGFLSNNMTAFYNGKTLDILDVESKYGHSAKKGMTVGLTLRGISEEELEKDSVLSFEKQ